MDDLLPRDVWILVCARLPFDDATRLLSLCRHVRDVDYWNLAVETHGHSFWARALSRRTRRRFTSMRDELRTLHLFETKLRAADLPRWTEADFYKWWDAEARYLAHSCCLPKLGVDGGEGARHGHGVCVRDGEAHVVEAVKVGLPRQLREHGRVLG
jgi:hypothetical protein